MLTKLREYLKLNYILTAALLSFVLLIPHFVMFAYYQPKALDLIHYAHILSHTSKQLWSGDFLPKWFFSANDGLGAPVGVFYPPMAYYLLSPLEFLSPIDQHGFHRVMIGLIFASVITAINVKKWLLAEGLNQKQAEFGGIIYMCSPVTMLAFCHHGISTYLAIGLYPLALYFITKDFQKDSQAYIKLSIINSIIITSHLPSYIVFFPLQSVYYFYKNKSQLNFKLLVKYLITHLSSLLVAGFYLVPFIENKQYIYSEAFTTGNFDYTNNFLSLVRFETSLLIPIFYCAWKTFSKANFYSLRFWYLSAIITIFMTTTLSKPIWHLLPFLQNLQFPSRFLPLLIPAKTMIFAYTYRKNVNLIEIKYGFYWMFLILSVIYAHKLTLKYPDEYANSLLNKYIITSQEYNTIWMKESGVSYFDLVRKHERFPQAFFTEGAGRIVVNGFSERRITLDISTDTTQAKLQLRKTFFPGWKVFMDNKKTNEVLISQKGGIMELSVPKGNYKLDLYWELPGETIGYLATIYGIVIIGTCFLVSYLKLWLLSERKRSLPCAEPENSLK